MNKHREIIYSRRNKILDSENIDSDVQAMISRQLSQVISSLIGQNKIDQIAHKVNEFLGIDLFTQKDITDEIEENISSSVIEKTLLEVANLKKNFVSEE
jgi:preprotein translocase subunit SecA